MAGCGQRIYKYSWPPAAPPERLYVEDQRENNNPGRRTSIGGLDLFDYSRRTKDSLVCPILVPDYLLVPASSPIDSCPLSCQPPRAQLTGANKQETYRPEMSRRTLFSTCAISNPRLPPPPPIQIHLLSFHMSARLPTNLLLLLLSLQIPRGRALSSFKGWPVGRSVA